MIRRDKYLNQLIKARNNGFPKVVTGVRRCGKSSLMKTVMEELKEQGVSEEYIILLDLDSKEYKSIKKP